MLVVLPTLGDRLDTLELALESVSAQRAESDITLVVVLPASAVDAIALAKNHGAVIVDDPRAGLAGAMNAGLAARTDEAFYCGLGDDDLLRPGGIALLLELIDRNPGAVVAYGACDYIDADGEVIGTNRAGALAARIIAWGPNLVPHPGTLIDLDALQAVGGFDESRPFTMDLDAFLKVKKRGRFVSSQVAVSAFRWHPDSTTVSNRRLSNREARAVKRSHLPAGLRPVSPLWSYPVGWATTVASRLVNSRAS